MNLVPDILFHSRYRLIKFLGRGSFGEVWLACDEQTGLEVAIKIYIALDDRGIDEFRTEYKTAYALNHPHLLHANFFDVCEQRPYLVMQYCPTSAVSLIGQIDEQTAWKFIRDVADGLAYLHEQDVVHRDIKPDNILRDANGRFLITDFGLSLRMRSTLRRNSTRQQNADNVAGTIGYMAPELFMANAEAVKATDIWALGATLYEMLTGELPFMGQGGVMQLHGAEVPVVRGEYSQALKDLVSACLAKDTWERPTAQQLKDSNKTNLNREKSTIVKKKINKILPYGLTYFISILFILSFLYLTITNSWSDIMDWTHGIGLICNTSAIGVLIANLLLIRQNKIAFWLIVCEYLSFIITQILVFGRTDSDYYFKYDADGIGAFLNVRVSLFVLIPIICFFIVLRIKRHGVSVWNTWQTFSPSKINKALLFICIGCIIVSFSSWIILIISNPIYVSGFYGK